MKNVANRFDFRTGATSWESDETRINVLFIVGGGIQASRQGSARAKTNSCFQDEDTRSYSLWPRLDLRTHYRKPEVADRFFSLNRYSLTDQRLFLDSPIGIAKTLKLRTGIPAVWRPDHQRLSIGFENGTFTAGALPAIGKLC